MKRLWPPIARGMALHAARHLLLLSLVLPIPVMAAGANIFCCNDERGKQVCGDILPMVCVGRAYREINQVGMVVHVSSRRRCRPR